MSLYCGNRSNLVDYLDCHHLLEYSSYLKESSKCTSGGRSSSTQTATLNATSQSLHRGGGGAPFLPSKIIVYSIGLYYFIPIIQTKGHILVFSVNDTPPSIIWSAIPSQKFWISPCKVYSNHHTHKKNTCKCCWPFHIQGPLSVS